MELIEGVVTQQNEQGDITYVTIDVQKHRSIITPVLEQLEVVKKLSVEEECAAGITVDELRKSLLQKVDELWQK